jgi:hypothetical protein
MRRGGYRLQTKANDEDQEITRLQTKANDELPRLQNSRFFLTLSIFCKGSFVSIFSVLKNHNSASNGAAQRVANLPPQATSPA